MKLQKYAKPTRTNKNCVAVTDEYKRKKRKELPKLQMILTNQSTYQLTTKAFINDIAKA